MLKSQFLEFLESWPAEFDHLGPTELYKFSDKPILIHLKGQKKDPLFVSTLLHGNETSGFLALKELFKLYGQELPRDMYIFLGNLQAAAKGQRHLPDQVDFNRIWNGPIEKGPEFQMANELIEFFKSINLLASVDLHNNTGNNPLYGCINQTNSTFLKLASTFSQKVVYFTEPHSVQSLAFSKFVPSLTIEAGRPGEKFGIDKNISMLRNLLEIESLEDLEINPHLEIFHTLGRIIISKEASFDFEYDKNSIHHFSFREDLEHLNFEALPQGTILGFFKNPDYLQVIDNDDCNKKEEFFELSDGEIILKKQMIPSMFTKDKSIIYNDCLGYLMEYFQ